MKETKKCSPNERTEQNSRKKKNQLSKMERANLSEADFITLIIRMLRELLEFGGKKKKEEMKVTLSEIKNNPQETNREGKEARIQTNDLEHKKEINSPGWCDSVD